MMIIIILISITPPPPCQACWSPCSHPSASPSGLGLAAPPWSSLWLWSWRCWWGWWWCCCWQHDDCVDAIEKKTDLSNKSLLWLSTLWPRSSRAVSTLRIIMMLRLIMMSMMIHLLIFPSSSFPKRSFEAALCLPILATWMIMDDIKNSYRRWFSLCWWLFWWWWSPPPSAAPPPWPLSLFGCL